MHLTALKREEVALQVRLPMSSEQACCGSPLLVNASHPPV